MADIFISYSDKDREWAERLAAALEKCGWSVWWDRRLLAGQSFDQTIERELGAAKAAVVLWSQNSIQSRWVRNEARTADARDVLTPARIDDAKLPLEFSDRQTASLVGWKGQAGHVGLELLRQSLAATLGASAAPPSQPATQMQLPLWVSRMTVAAAIVVLIAGATWFALGPRVEEGHEGRLANSSTRNDVVAPTTTSRETGPSLEPTTTTISAGSNSTPIQDSTQRSSNSLDLSQYLVNIAYRQDREQDANVVRKALSAAGFKINMVPSTLSGFHIDPGDPGDTYVIPSLALNQKVIGQVEPIIYDILKQSLPALRYTRYHITAGGAGPVSKDFVIDLF